MTVLNVAYPFAPVGPDAVGGAEQVVHQLDRALAEAGHRSLVLACEGSRAIGELTVYPGFGHNFHDRTTRRSVYRGYREVLHRLVSQARPDLVHLHGIDFISYFPETEVPILVTLHLPLDWYPPACFHLKERGVYYHCVSASQRERSPTVPNLLPEIPNGVPIESLASGVRKRHYVAGLGRICPEKGFHHALDAAREANVSMLLAGQVFPFREHERYFELEIRPRLDASRRFIGPVGFRAKRRLLGSSRCLLVPSLAPETSSLVVMEALACGTPVIAFASGALVDLVEDGVTGYLVSNWREMAQAIHRLDLLEPSRCRQQAKERFSLEKSNAAYLELYHKLASGACLGSAQTCTAPWQPKQNFTCRHPSAGMI